MISMGDVARQAGVAKSTVSRILSGNGSFCPETCTKVFDACEKLNYKLNPNIQDLVLKGRGGATRNIAVLPTPTGLMHSAEKSAAGIII